MAEPLPTTVQEGNTTLPPTTSSDPAAAAISSLDSSSAPATDANAPASKADPSTLNSAMQALDVAPKTDESKSVEKSEREKASNRRKEEEERRRKIKVNAAEVGVVGEYCDLNKVAATELLRRFDGDLGRALRGFVGVGA